MEWARRRAKEADEKTLTSGSQAHAAPPSGQSAYQREGIRGRHTTELAERERERENGGEPGTATLGRASIIYNVAVRKSARRRLWGVKREETAPKTEPVSSPS